MDEQAVILLFVFKWSKCKMELIRACLCHLGRWLEVGKGVEVFGPTVSSVFKQIE